MVDLFIVIISGLSGSGKSHAIKCFEDIGYFCVDNLPPALLPKFVDLCSQSGQQIPRIAVGIDIRERAFFRDFADVFKGLREGGMQVELLFFEADNASIMRRFSESRRPHPLAPDRPVLDGIRLERERLSELRNMADRIIDTTAITVHQLKDMIQDRYRMIGAGTGLHVAIVSFGFKFGIPYDADLLFDVRFIKNPNFAPTLKNFTGMDPQVRKFVFSDPHAIIMLDKIKDLVSYALSQYIREERSYVTIGIGCTGGRHRSVAMVERLKEDVESLDIEMTVRHRDVDR